MFAFRRRGGCRGAALPGWWLVPGAMSLMLSLAVACSSGSSGGTSGGGGGGGPPPDGGVFSGGDQPPTSTGTIAYVRGNELRLVEPDGSGDHLVWSAPNTSSAQYYVMAPAWRPNGWEIAFSSDHEEAYSIFERDLYAVRPDGIGLRRLTNAPMHEQLTSYGKGTVRATIQNDNVEYSLFVAILQGADPQFVSVPAGAQVTVTFTDVADLGAGAQPVVVAYGAKRWLGAVADVKAGQTVDASGTVHIDAYGVIEGYGANEPFWRADSTRVGYLGAYCQLLQVPSNPTAGAVYDPLVSSDAFFNTCPVEWGPTAATADQLVARDGSDYADTSRIHVVRMKEGATTKPAPVVSLDPDVQMMDLHWLSDGSGVVFARPNAPIEPDVNVWQYEFASDTLVQVTDLHFAEGVMNRFAMSPDGQRIAFEMIDRNYGDSMFSGFCDLWVMNRDGSGAMLLARDARQPAWNPLR